jgi:hypothetical protein
VLLRCSSNPCPLFVRYMSGTCSVKHRTSTEHQWELLPCRSLAPLELHWGYIGATHWEHWRYSFDRDEKYWRRTLENVCECVPSTLSQSFTSVLT